MFATPLSEVFCVGLWQPLLREWMTCMQFCSQRLPVLTSGTVSTCHSVSDCSIKAMTPLYRCQCLHHLLGNHSLFGQLLLLMLLMFEQHNLTWPGLVCNQLQLAIGTGGCHRRITHSSKSTGHAGST